jgi:3-oxoacyl-[acyl-carrier protein] reductase
MTQISNRKIQKSNTEPRVALIAGGVRGIGKAVSLELAGQGWKLAVCYRKSHDDAAALDSELRARGAHALLVRSDVSKPETAESLVRQAESEYGRIDALIHCIGSYRRIPLMEESIEGWHDMFDHNLHSFFYLSRLAAAGMMQRRWGRIVSFSIVNADQQIGQPFITAHYIAKMGVLALTRSLAKTLAPFGVTANTISPGFIETGSVPRDVIAQSMKSIPAGYVGSPDDAVGAVCYLLSDEARYVNGTNIHLSGAWGI